MRWIVSGSITRWLIGTVVPWILIAIGAPAEMKMSEAFLSAMTWNSLSRITAGLRRQRLQWISKGSGAQQFVDAGLGARLRVDPLHDDRAVQAVLAVG